ncbi:ATP-binding protein [Amedibacterium intestinale]|uniref:ATP-binding protein n=1 Tax=Amedibacterium intestinale TaxID=2583452 RepID=UPI000E20C63F
MDKYMTRIADKVIAERLEAKGAILIEGPKWCGKTTTGKHLAKSVIEMDRPEMTNQYKQMAELNPSVLLTGEVPHMIDEWQIAPNLWNAVRYEVDQRDEFGQFILTGSSVPASLDSSAHTGTGRIGRIKMRPMSLFESKDSSGSVSLASLFKGENISGMDSHDIKSIAYLICRGGWPKAIGTTEKVALRQAFDYYDAIVNDDINRVDGEKKDRERTARLLKSYARNVSQQASLESIREDVIVNDIESFSQATLYSYIDSLKKIFVIEDSPAWNPNLRSKTAIRTTDTRYFVDPSIASSALGLGPNDLISDLNTMGLIFENLCIRDLRVYADSLDGQIYHYRDKSGLECDAVIHLRNGDYGLIEIKLGGDKLIEEGAKSLLKLSDKIDTTKMKKPSFLMILCGVAPFAYQRKDGVFVVPIGCLKD